MSLTPERMALLRKHWADGVSIANIADALGGYEDKVDKGRAVLCGIIKRLRDNAKKAGDHTEAKFWTRGKSAAIAGKPKTRKGTGAARMSAGSSGIRHEDIAPATLKSDGEPLWRGGAFAGALRSRDNPDGLTPGELAAFAEYYK